MAWRTWDDNGNEIIISDNDYEASKGLVDYTVEPERISDDRAELGKKAYEKMQSDIMKSREAITKGGVYNPETEETDYSGQSFLQKYVVSPLLAASEFVAPKSYEETMQRGGTSPTMTNVKEAAPLIIGAATGLGAEAGLAKLGTMRVGAAYPYLAAVGTGLAGGLGYEIPQYMLNTSGDKSYTGFSEEATVPLAVGTAFGPVGKGVEKFFGNVVQKAYNVSPEFVKGLGRNTIESIGNRIDEKISQLIAKSKTGNITPKQIQEATEKSIDDAIGMGLTKADASKLKILAKNFYGDLNEDIQMNLLPGEGSDILRTPEQIQARLKALKGQQKYESPFDYTVGEKGQARVFARKGLEQVAGPDAATIFRLQQMQKGIRTPEIDLTRPLSFGSYFSPQLRDIAAKQGLTVPLSSYLLEQ